MTEVHPARQVTGSPPRRDAPADLMEEMEQLGIGRGSYDFQPLQGLRKVIARRMTHAAREVPHYYLQRPVRLDALMALRQRVNAEEQTRVSLNDFFIRAAALVLADHKDINVSFTAQGLLYHRHADIAFAAAMDGGLVTPIVRAAETKSVREIAAETKDLALRGRAKRLAPAEYTGGTFTISNLGMYGVTAFSSIINTPQACILSIGAGERRLLLVGDSPEPAVVMTATLTCDHRAVDGAAGAAWLQSFCQIIENPTPLAP